MRVFVYMNLTKNCWSVKALDKANFGKVLFHADAVHLMNAMGSVSKAGRARVLKEKVKNVHAGVVGQLCTLTNPTIRYEADLSEFDVVDEPIYLGKEPDVSTIHYNPYKAGHFYLDHYVDKEWVGSTDVVLGKKGVLGIMNTWKKSKGEE